MVFESSHLLRKLCKVFGFGRNRLKNIDDTWERMYWSINVRIQLSLVRDETHWFSITFYNKETRWAPFYRCITFGYNLGIKEMLDRIFCQLLKPQRNLSGHRNSEWYSIGLDMDVYWFPSHRNFCNSVSKNCWKLGQNELTHLIRRNQRTRSIWEGGRNNSQIFQLMPRN